MNIDKDTANSASLFQGAVNTAIAHNEHLTIPVNLLKQFKEMFDECVKSYDEAYEDGYNAGAGDEYFNEH